MNRRVSAIVHVNRRNSFASPALSASALRQLESAFRACPLWRDRWGNRQFRAAAREVLRETGDLVLIGPGVSFDVPAPFVEMFEPIELASGLADNRDRLKVLSGEKPTKQERWRWIGITLVVGGVLAVVLGLMIAGFLHGHRSVALAVLVGTAMLAGLVYLLVVALQRRGGRWFLVPGAIAIARRPVRRGLPARITVLARGDTCLVYRPVHTGKVTVLVLELWPHGGRPLRRAVSEREALSALAAWQSPLAPPEDEMLQEIVTW